MAVRALSLPSFSGGFFNVLRRPVVYYGVYTVVLFAIFLAVTFPLEILVRRALDLAPQNSVAIAIDGAELTWWPPGVEVEGGKVSAVPLKEGAPPIVEVARLRVHPVYRDLLKGDPYSWSLWAELYGGTAEGRLSRLPGSPPSVAAHLEWAGVEVRRYRALTTWLDEGRIAGSLAGWFDGTINPGAPPQGEGEIFLQHAGLTGGKIMGFTVPELNIDDAKSKFIIKGDRLEVQDVSLTGNDLGLQVKGFVTLREPPSQSVPNLTLTIQKLPESLKGLVTFFAPKAKTLPAQIVIGGTLGRPQVR